MLLSHLLPKLEEKFAGQFSIATNGVVFPSKHPDVGSVEIVGEDCELRVCVGYFTHVHFANYDDSLTPD